MPLLYEGRQTTLGARQHAQTGSIPLLPFCTKEHWLLIVFDFGAASVQVWNKVNSHEEYKEDTVAAINSWKKCISDRLGEPNILKGPVLWNESVQQGVYYDFGKTIIKIMECIVTGAPLDLTQDYFSRARNHATQNILAIQFDRHLLPDL